jgi:nicotinate phosphoribosyltransferase
MDTSADAPYLDCAYKLVEYAGKARRKRSEGKVLWPGRKQVYRRYDTAGRMGGDALSLETDRLAGESLIVPAMKSGQRVAPAEPLQRSRERALAELARLPEELKSLGPAPAYPVIVGEALKDLAREVDRVHGCAERSSRPCVEQQEVGHEVSQ